MTEDNEELGRIITNIKSFSEGVSLRDFAFNLNIGDHESRFIGTGFDFHRMREFDPSLDTARDIDWRQGSSRPGEHFVREYIEERQISVILLADLSSSLNCGLGGETPFKRQTMLEILGTIGVTAAKQQDRVACVGFTDKVVIDFPLRWSAGSVYHFVRTAYKFMTNPDNEFSQSADLYNAIEFVNRRYRLPSLVFVISDFIECGDMAKSQVVKNLGGAHDGVFLFIDDFEELDVGNVWLSRIRVRNVETGEDRFVSARAFREAKEKASREREDMIEQLRLVGIDSKVIGHGDHLRELAAFLKERR